MKRAAILVSALALIAVVVYLVLSSQTGGKLFRQKPASAAAPVVQSTKGATAVPPVITPGDQIVVEGQLVPARFVNLGFNTGGLISDVFVSEGDEVNDGQILAALSYREQYEANVATAQLELVNAQQEIKNLYDNAPLAAAEALQAVVNAPSVVKETEATLNSLKSGVIDQTDIDVAQANLTLAEKKLKDAQDRYKPYENKPENNLVRAALLNQLSQAQKEYDAALRNYNAITGTPDTSKITQAEANLELAKAQQADAERKYEILKNGPDPDQVALAEARLSNAEVQLAAAQASLLNLEMRAPFTGTVASVSLKPGEYVAPGVPLLLLVDFSDWAVETTDLTELNVVRILAGSPAIITCDALPDVHLIGKVDRIKPVGENRNGDITYTAIIGLDQHDPRLLWNMTCSVAIKVEG